MRYWLRLRAKTAAIRSQPHPEHGCQWSITDCLSCIVANERVAMQQEFIYDVLAAISSETVPDISVTPL